MKKPLTLILTIIICVAVFPLVASAEILIPPGFLAPIEPIPDDVREENIVRVNNENIRNIDWFQAGKYYILTEDIDLSDEEWVPIGYESGATAFIGVFDGRGHVIRNMTITGDYRIAGFFWNADFSEIKNIGFENIYINVSSSETVTLVGGIAAGSRDTVISNCYMTGDIYANSENGVEAAGLVGYSVGLVFMNCFNAANISAIAIGSTDVVYANAGGIFCGSSLIVDNCLNTGNIYASGEDVSHAGGIAHFNVYTEETAFIKNSYNIGNISAKTNKDDGHAVAGGIVAFNIPDVQIISCYWSINAEQIINGVPRTDVEKRGIGSGYDHTTSLTTAEILDKFNLVEPDTDVAPKTGVTLPLLPLIFIGVMRVSADRKKK